MEQFSQEVATMISEVQRYESDEARKDAIQCTIAVVLADISEQLGAIVSSLDDIQGAMP